MTMDEKEAESIRKLLIEDRKLWGPFHFEPASDRAEEMCCGWKPTRPSAAYDLTKPGTKRKKTIPTPLAASTLSLCSKDDKSPGKCPYMSGELDENYTYVYKGGLSSRAETMQRSGSAITCAAGSVQNPFHAQLQRKKHVQTVTFEPSLPSDASAHMQALANCRSELSRILSLQMKPELLVEHLIIENRLRAMSLAAFPVLESTDSHVRRNDRTYSHSTPALGSLPNTHVNYQSPRHRQYHGKERHSRTKSLRHEAKPHLQWCDSLSSHRSSKYETGSGKSHAHMLLPQLSHHQSALHLRKRSSNFTHSKQTNNPSTQHDGNCFVDPHTSPPYRLPVVAPSLPYDVACERQSKSNKRLNTLLYKPDRPKDCSRRLTTDLSLHYPHVSYHNSKPMRYE